MAETRITTKADLERIRLNQRRCRARKQEYLRGLEEEVAKSRAAGRHASVELQAAARKVDRENKCLRWLLRKFGADDLEIEKKLEIWNNLDALDSSLCPHPLLAVHEIGMPTAQIHPPTASAALSQGPSRMPDGCQQTLTSEPYAQPHKEMMQYQPTQVHQTQKTTPDLDCPSLEEELYLYCSHLMAEDGRGYDLSAGRADSVYLEPLYFGGVLG